MSRTAREPLHTNEATAGCESGEWGPPAEDPPTVTAEEQQMEPMSMFQFVSAIGTLVLALPAIIGAWCWPMLVAAIFNVGAGFMNGGAGTGVVDFFHGLQVAIMMTLMLNLTQFVWWTCKRQRQGTCLQVHAPTLLVLLSAILVNIQPMWILVIGSWELCCAPCEVMGLAAEYCPASGFTYKPWPRTPNVARECNAPGGNVFWDVSYCTGNNLSIFPTVASGWAVQIICTWGGYVAMFIGVFQATKLHLKLKKRWTAIRRGQMSARR